jgi:hypothetical protein
MHERELAGGAIESRAYSDRSEHILKLVDQSDECRVIDVNADQLNQYQELCSGKLKQLTNSPPGWPP